MIPAIIERFGELEQQVGVETLNKAYEVLDALLAPLGRWQGTPKRTR
jgi:hypothetical protein